MSLIEKKPVLVTLLFVSVSFIAILILLFTIVVLKDLPSPDKLGESGTIPYSTHILDRNGKLLYEIYREQNRTPVKLSTLPKYVSRATIAIEDKGFYTHRGISLVGGVLRALKENLKKGDPTFQGGSTITQQLVKSALLTPERTITRKLKEIVLALMVEQKYTKQEILEMYLNQVPYGGTAWGIEEASKMYFGKPARALSLPEAAFLAGLPQAPSIYSPYVNPKAAAKRQKEVLTRMYEEGYITKQQFRQALFTQLSFKKPSNTILAPHFVFYVKGILEREYGQRTVQEGGLRVTTTLDYTLQKKAEKILNDELSSLKGLNVTNGAILVTRPSTGEILAMVGSRNFFEGSYGAYNVTIAKRQPGSSIKPVMYTLALKRGMTAATLINDRPVQFSIQGSAPYRPRNYDNRFHGWVPLRYALANSYNIPAVLTLKKVGVENFVEFAKTLGIESWEQERNRFGLSLTLGGGEVTMTEFATAYGVLRNLGIKRDVYAIQRIENIIGTELFNNKSSGYRIMREDEPFIISDILADNIARTPAFGVNSPLNFGNRYISVKTGTTDNLRDNWTVGYTRPTVDSKEPDILVMVWVGNNNNQPMNGVVSGITGAAPIWRSIMESVVSPSFFSEKLYVPNNIVKKKCLYGRDEYFVKGTEKNVRCRGYKLSITPNSGE